MRSHLTPCTAMLLVVFGNLTSSALAKAPNAAASLSAPCFPCHGTDGVSVGGVPPSLAGQNKEYLLQQMKDFKAGKRPATIMHQQAKGYSDAQLEQISAYFASMKPAAARGGN